MYSPPRIDDARILVHRQGCGCSVQRYHRKCMPVIETEFSLRFDDCNLSRRVYLRDIRAKEWPQMVEIDTSAIINFQGKRITCKNYM